MTDLPAVSEPKGWRERVTPDEITRTVLDAVHTAAESRWEPAQRRAAELFGVTHEQKLIAVRKHFHKEVVGLGTATGAVGSIPGAGTATAIGVGIADIGWGTVRNADVIFTIAALHGHEAEVEERTAWVLALLVFGDDAAASYDQLARELGKKAASVATSATMKKMNRAMAKKVFRSYGTKKGFMALGKALPFGAGAVFGGVSSHRDLKGLIGDADRFFTALAHRPVRLELAPPEG